MRIAICTDQYKPMLSGAVDSIQALALQLMKNGHEVRIYAPALRGAKTDEHVFLFPAYSIPGTADAFIIVLPTGAMADIKKFKPDIIHTNFPGVAGFFAWYASRRLKVPFIGTDHTLPADYLHYLNLDYRPFRWFVRRFSSWFYNKCLIITAPSKHVLDELADYGCSRPMQQISNPILTDLFRPLEGKDVLKQKYGIGRKAVLVFGRLAVEKNLDFALDIFADVAEKSDAELVFIGDGPSRTVLEQKVNQKALTSRVHFLGTLRGEVLVEAINTCDAFLITSLSDTQSMAMLQAMAVGLPVVAIRAGGLPEYVEEGVTGYVVDPKNRTAFVEHLLKILNDPELERTLGEKGRVSSLKFSPENITKQFEEVYKKALSSKGF